MDQRTRTVHIQEPVDGDALRDCLLRDLRRSITASHERLAAAKLASKPFADPEHAFALAGMVELHAQTGDDEMLNWARDDLIWLVQSAVEPDGTVRPFMTSLRHLQPFCEAFVALTEQRLLAEGDWERAAAQIAANASSKFDYLDWGPHNRATVDGASLLWAACAVPNHPDARKWRGYGEALFADSWGHWSIEDASIYQPLWMVYLLTGAEALNRRDEFLGLVTTRYYFEYWAQLLMPNGMLPDWGDADWTLSWEWYVASLIAAGSAYRDGRYLWCASRVYDAYAGYRDIEGREGAPLDAYATYCAALALRWLDTGLAFAPYELSTSHEVLEDLVGKKIVFRNDPGRGGAYALLNYRDEGPYASVARDYLNQQLAAYEEKPHHGHADENAFILLMEDQTVLLADGGYRLGITPEAYRADFFHSRIVARTGFPVEGDVFDYIAQNRMYAHVQTEKLHFGTFGVLDYSRTRLVDADAGYTADRMVLFAPAEGMYVVVDAIHVDRTGHKTFANVWHPEHVLRHGADYVVSWPPQIAIRRDYWINPHRRDLLIQFLDTRGKPAVTKEITRRFNPSTVFYQSVWGHFFAGQRFTFVTLLAPHTPGGFAETMLQQVKIISGSDRDSRSLGLSLMLDGCPATIGLKMDRAIGLTNLRGRPMFDVDAGSLAYGALASDADFAFAVDRGDEVEYGFINGSRLQYGGVTYFEVPVKPQMFQWFIEGGVPAPRDRMPRYHDRAQNNRRR